MNDIRLGGKSRLRYGAIAFAGSGLLALLHCSAGPGAGTGTGSSEPVAQTSNLTLLAPTAATASGSEYGVWGALGGLRDWTTGTGQVGDGSQWVSFDMGDEYPFDTITLDCSGHTTDYPGSVDLYVSDDGVNWGSKVKTTTGSCPMTTINGFGTLTHEFIKLVQSGSQNPNHYWTIDQLNVSSGGTTYNPTVTYTTLVAPNGTNESAWLGTSSYEGIYAASKAIDGDPGTRFSSDFDDQAWFQVDLGSAKNFDDVKIYWELAGALSFALQTSTDNQNWTTLYVSNDAPSAAAQDPTVTSTCPSGYDPSKCSLQNIPVPGSSGRYVRFQGLQRSSQYGYSFYAFEVYSGGAELALTEKTGIVTAAETTLSSKRGSAYHLCGWSSSAGQHDVDAIKGNTRWTYNWSDRPGDCVQGSADLTGGNPNVEFVPMVWGWSGGSCTASSTSASNCSYKEDCVDNNTGNCTNKTPSQIVSDIKILNNAKYVLGYNEPDFSHQSNLTPKAAAGQWADIEYVSSQFTGGAGPGGHLAIVGPAVNFCDSHCTTDNAGCCTVVSDTALSGERASSGQREQAFRWLEHFYDECRASYVIDGTTYKGRAGHNCEIDYQAAHSYSWYGIWSINPLKIKAGITAPTATHCSNGTKDGDEDGKDCGGEDCKACDSAVQGIFAKQVWLTEFAPTTDDCGYSGCINNQVSQAQTYINNWVSYGGNPGSGNQTLEHDSFVFRYAWFMPKVTGITSLNNDSLLVSSDTTHDPTQSTVVGTSYFNAGYSSSCTPKTCSSLGDNCGSVGDGCGGTLNCGTCTSPQTCGGGGTANVCGGGGGGGGTALSRNGWTGTSNPSSSGYPTSNLFDALSNNSRWSTGAYQAAGQVLTVDMQSSQSFHQIKLDSSNGSTNMGQNVNVDISTDNSHWTNLVTGNSGASGITYATSNGVATVTASSSQTARYIRVTLEASYSHWWSIYDFEVYQ